MPKSRGISGGLTRGRLFDTNIKATQIDEDIFSDQTLLSTIAGDDLVLVLDVSETPDKVKYITRTNFVAGITSVTVTDNESTDENNLIPFVADAATSTGAHGLEMDGDFNYNPSTGTLTTTILGGTLSTASQPNVTTLAGVTTMGAVANALTLTFSDATLFHDANNADTSFTMGTSATEALKIEVLNGGSNKTAESIAFTSTTASGTGDHGKFTFSVDEATAMFTIDDGGVSIAESGAYEINGTAILSDSSGTLTLQNVDALDATTESTIEAALDTLSNLASATGLTTIGAAGATTNVAAGDVTFFNPVNNGNPTLSLGSDSNERLIVTSTFDSGAQTLDKVTFETAAASGAGDKGKYVFNVDGTDIFDIDDSGINLASGKTFRENGDAVIGSVHSFSAGAIANGDSFIFSDANDSNATKKEAIADLATLFAGTGLTASSSVISVDAAQSGITSLGTLTGLTLSGDIDIFEDANNADVTLRMGTSATESLSIEVLNGGSNKTAEAIHFSTATASGTANHGKMVFDIDGTDQFEINDSGVVVTGDLTITGDDLFMNTNTDGMVLVADGTNFNPVQVSGDVELSNSGATTIQAGAVEHGMLADDIISGQAEITSGFAAADELMYSDAGTIKRVGLDVLATKLFSVAAAGTVAQASDFMLFLDNGATGDVIVESIDDFLSAIAGSGISVSSSQLTAASSATALDDIATGDGASNLVTTVGNITLDAQANDADVIIKVDDNGSSVTAVTFDGSDEGNAIFVNDIQLKSDSAVLALGADLDATLTHDGTTGLTIAANPFEVDSGGNITLDAHTGIFIFQDANTEILRLTESGSGDVTVKLETNAKDLIFTDNGDAEGFRVLDGAGGIRVAGGLNLASASVAPVDTAHNAAGTAASISAGNTTAGTTNNIAGGSLTIQGGQGKGSGAGGDIIFKTANAGGSGSTLNSLATALTISDDLNSTFADNVLLGSDSAVLSLGADADATLTHDGTTGLTIAANPFEVDSGGNITLDAHTGVWIFQDANTEVLRITESGSGDVTVKLETNAKDLIFTDNGDAEGFRILDAAAGVTVAGKTTTNTIELGHASDTTIARSGSGAITVEGTQVLLAGAQTGVTTILNAGTKIGRDSQNLIDFATTDNKIIFRVNNVNEVELIADTLSPVTSDGVALGTGSLMWSDLFLASGSVVNFNNGDVTLTHSSETLTVGGGTLATAALTTSTIVASGIVKTDDTTNATSTTDGSLQTDGGLSVALDGIFGDDVTLITDDAVLNLGVGSDVKLTHDGTTGGTLSGTPMTVDSLGASALANDTFTGMVFGFISNEAIAIGNAVYIHTTDGRIGVADANALATMPAIGVAVSATGSAGNAVKVLTHGIYNDSDGFGGDLTEGVTMYLGETTGAVTATIPDADGDFVQVMGVACGPRDVFINPSLDIIERA